MNLDIAWYIDLLSARNAERSVAPTWPTVIDSSPTNERLRRALSGSDEAPEIVGFWREAGPKRWFAKEPEFDRAFRERFLEQYEAAARGELMDWTVSPAGTLGLLLLLDQFPRNAFRGTPRMYATDELALGLARAAIDARHDLKLAWPELQLFFYLPFAHSEDPHEQERSVALTRRLGDEPLRHAEGHRDIIRRFGRFPHRNPILGRAMTEEEQRFLDEGGFAG
jgi:uncharacterized protein (DUF924 family)